MHKAGVQEQYLTITGLVPIATLPEPESKQNFGKLQERTEEALAPPRKKKNTFTVLAKDLIAYYRTATPHKSGLYVCVCVCITHYSELCQLHF